MSLFASLIPTRFTRSPPERRALLRSEPGSNWAATGEIDGFRAYADIYGKRFADDALFRIRDALAGVSRGRARIHWRSSDSFVAVMAGGSLDGALDLADDFRAAVEVLQIPHQGSHLGILTVSLGIAPLAGDGDEARVDAIVRAADALARAQTSGPNHVLAAGLTLA